MDRLRLGFSTLAALFLAMACKPAAKGGAAEVKSLENYVAADGTELVQNQCEGPYLNKEFAAAEHIDVSDELQDDFAKALSAIPTGLRELFSARMLGKYTVTSEAARLCGAAVENITESRFASGALDTTTCLKSTSGQPGVELVVPANGGSIRHSLVRAFFAASFRVMAMSTYNKKLKLFTVGKPSDELAKVARAVTIALREDMQTQGRDDARMRKIFGDKLAGATEAAAMMKAYDETPKAEREQISLAAFRESADQYYCSPKTRLVMRDRFPKAYKAFKTLWVKMMHEQIEEKDPEELLGENVPAGLGIADSDDGKKDGALGLWGNWGPGSGPLRAWGESRMEARAEGGQGAFPNWHLARQEGLAAGGGGTFPKWGAARQEARAELKQAGLPGASLFPGFWANRLLGD